MRSKFIRRWGSALQNLRSNRELFSYCGVYALYFVVNNELLYRYIGASKDVFNRLSTHLRELQKGVHDNTFLQSVWNKYGDKALYLVKLEECLPEERFKVEQIFVDSNDKLVNLQRIVTNSPVDPSKEIRELLSDSTKRLWANGTLKGKPKSDEVRRQMSERRKAWWAADPERKKQAAKRLSPNFCCKKKTEEQRKEASERMILFYQSKEGEAIKEANSETMKKSWQEGKITSRWLNANCRKNA